MKLVGIRLKRFRKPDNRKLSMSHFKQKRKIQLHLSQIFSDRDGRPEDLQD